MIMRVCTASDVCLCVCVCARVCTVPANLTAPVVVPIRSDALQVSVREPLLPNGVIILYNLFL